MKHSLNRFEYKEKYREDKRYNAEADDFENEYSLRNSKHGLKFETERITQLFGILNKHKIHLEDRKILDIGCNYGLYSLLFAYLKRSSNDVFGIDFLEKSIQTAKSINPVINYQQRDLYEGLDFPNEFFDFILVNYVLNCITERREEVIADIASKVKVGGHILFFDFFGDYQNNIVYYLEGLFRFRNPVSYSKQKIEIKKDMFRHASVSIEELKRAIPNCELLGRSVMLSQKKSKASQAIQKLIQTLVPNYHKGKYSTILVTKVS